jgi:anaerobic ribonucleoside-triphosphate reductase activating protein
MNYSQIRKFDVTNGPGVRTTLFVSGCTHRCKNCFNQEAWDFNYSQPFTEDTINTILDYCKHEYVEGLTILGGEPFEPANQKGILPLVKKFKDLYPDKTLWVFTGYDFEEDLLDRMYNNYPETKQLLARIDTIVDGKFIEELTNRNLRFKGSSNQRTIMVQETMKTNQLVLWDDTIHTEFTV